MAIKHLTEEQIRTMTVEEKDRWWLENVYKGDVPQFTVRSVRLGIGQPLLVHVSPSLCS